MEIIESVFNLSKQFMKDPDYVHMNKDVIDDVAEKMLKEGKTPFEKRQEYCSLDVHKITLMQLTAGAINYCYWYGKSDVRPDNCSSTKMYSIVEEAGNKYLYGDPHSFFSQIKVELAKQRFPLLEERLKHINEIQKNHYSFVNRIIQKEKPFNELFEMMIELFPGYASDLFLKRVSLFFMMLYRIFGWFSEDLYHIHIASDYQIPKMLVFYGCIDYTPALEEIIILNELIPKGSQMECEIRAATILVCQRLCQKTKWNAAEVDGWFWLKRKECHDPFHLTITTDY